MPELDHIEASVIETWGEQSTAYAMFRAIVYGKRPSAYNHLTLVALRRLSGETSALGDVLAAAEYFAGEALNLFERHFELLKDEHAVDISIEDLCHALVTGVLLDPETAEEVPDWKALVIPYYVPTDRLRSIIREREQQSR